MIQVMSSVVQEVNCVSQELMDIILINILEPAKVAHSVRILLGSGSVFSNSLM